MQNRECIILEFPSGRPIVDRKDYPWNLEDFQKCLEDEELQIVAIENKQYTAQRYGKKKLWVNIALLFGGRGEYMMLWHSGKDGAISIRSCKEREARSLYHNAQTKLISWRELFPGAKLRPYERKYLEEPAVEQTAPG